MTALIFFVLIFLSFRPSFISLLLADLVLSNKLVLYDLENQTIGWTEYNCEYEVFASLFSKLSLSLHVITWFFCSFFFSPIFAVCYLNFSAGPQFFYDRPLCLKETQNPSLNL